MPPFKERVDVVAMGLEARLEAPVKTSIMKKAGCLVAWRDADMERRAMRCSSLASTLGRTQSACKVCVTRVLKGVINSAFSQPLYLRYLRTR